VTTCDSSGVLTLKLHGSSHLDRPVITVDHQSFLVCQFFPGAARLSKAARIVVSPIDLVPLHYAMFKFKTQLAMASLGWLMISLGWLPRTWLGTTYGCRLAVSCRLDPASHSAARSRTPAIFCGATVVSFQLYSSFDKSLVPCPIFSHNYPP
jgi:hypothetical protein